MHESSTLSGRKKFLSAVTVIGAAVFSATAFATTLTPGDWEYVPFPASADSFAFATVNVAGNPPFTGTMQFNEVAADGTLLPIGPSGSGGLRQVFFVASTQMGEATIQINDVPSQSPLGEHTIRAAYSGDAANPPSALIFTIVVTTPGWLPPVLQGLLID